MVKLIALSAGLRAKELKATKHLIAFVSYKKCRFPITGVGIRPDGTSPIILYIYVQVLVVSSRQLNSVSQLVRALYRKRKATDSIRACDAVASNKLSCIAFALER